jgi:hypothetical protein
VLCAGKKGKLKDMTGKGRMMTCKLQAADDGQAQGHDVQADGQGQAADDVVDEAIVVVVGRSCIQWRDTDNAMQSDLDLILDGPSAR